MGWLKIAYLGQIDGAPPARPVIPSLHNPAYGSETPLDLKVLALEWAKRWLRIAGEMDISGAVADLDLLLDGKPMKYGRMETPEGRILHTALMATHKWRNDAACERTKRSFPWLTFVAVEGSGYCPGAAQRNGRLAAYEDREPIPLPSCTAGRCDCHYLQRTNGWVARHAANHDLSSELGKDQL